MSTQYCYIRYHAYKIERHNPRELLATI